MELLIFENVTENNEYKATFKFQYGATNIKAYAGQGVLVLQFKFQYGATNIIF